MNRAQVEDRVREAIHTALSGSEYLPESIVLLTDLVVAFGCIDTDASTNGTSRRVAGSLGA